MHIDILTDKYLYLLINSNISINLYNTIIMLLPIIVLSLIFLFRNFSRLYIYIGILFLNIGLFCFIYFFLKNLIIYIPYILMMFVVIIFADDYERLKIKKEKDSRKITDEGEIRLETNIYSDFMTNNQKKRKEIEEEKQKLKSREIIELFSDKDIFINRMYVNEDIYKDLLLYDEIKASDNIIEEIYYLIKDDGYINRKKFKNILIKNNIIIDINNYAIEEEIRILEILSLRELKNISREKQEKQILKEKEDALQIDKKEEKIVEETNSIRYNDKEENNVNNKERIVENKSSIKNLNNRNNINNYENIDNN